MMEVWERQSTATFSLFVFGIMADLLYANYNITGSCYISGKSNSFTEMKNSENVYEKNVTVDLSVSVMLTNNYPEHFQVAD